MSGLQRTLGLPALTYYGVGTIIGAGIYSVIGVAAGHVGPSLWQSFLLASVVAGLTALSYAELVAAIPKVGGEYSFLHRASGRRRGISFIGGFVVALAGVATAATVSIAFAGYLARFVGMPQWLSAFLLLAAATGVNIAGIRQSTWANMVLTSIQVLGLIIVIGAGISAGNITEPLGAPPESGVFVATALLFFVYTGFEGMANLAEEAKRPEKDLPRAILLSIVITTVVYFFVALAVVTLADPDELGESDAPLSLAAGKAHASLETALAWFALCATATTALITFITISRLLLGMARDGNMPKPLTRLLPGRGSPWVAALVLFVAASLLIPLGDVGTVASVASLTTLVAFVAVNVCLIVLRRNEPDLERPFRIRGSVRGYPVLPIVAIAASIALATRFEPVVYAIAGAAFAFAGLMYLLWARNLPDKPDET